MPWKPRNCKTLGDQSIVGHPVPKRKTTSQKDNLKLRQPHRKTTSQEDNITGEQSHRMTTSQEDNLIGRQPQWRMTSQEDNFTGRQPQTERRTLSNQELNKSYLCNSQQQTKLYLSLAHLSPSLFLVFLVLIEDQDPSLKMKLNMNEKIARFGCS